ncbi:MAG: hypothetical protein JSR18_12100 [Proteobacteria bacterium]|nr:hypothetical protein [Pseudomonadota bacterium]
MLMSTVHRVALAALVATVLAACTPAYMKPEQPGPLPPNTEPPPPPINLSGFPLPYRQGYADGCASVDGPERKDAARFASDGNYRTGWTDGVSLCRKK